MRMTTLTIAAAFTFAATSAASAACGGHQETVAQTPVDTKKLVEPVDVAAVPVDAWLIKYLEAWDKA